MAGGSGHYNPHVMFGTLEAFISSLQIHTGAMRAMHAGCAAYGWRYEQALSHRIRVLAIVCLQTTIHIQLKR